MAGVTVVTGATGTLGQQLVPRLVAAGHSVRAISRQPPSPDGTGVKWTVADLREPAGLDAALTGAGVLVHCATTMRGDADRLRDLLAAARRAGSPHLVYISIVGCDRVAIGYYRTKTECEDLLLASGLPVTILRATQFHELIAQLFAAQRRLPVLLVPSGTRFQPIDAGVCADHLVQAASGEPAGRLPDIGGPEAVDAADLARQYLAATGRRRRVVGVRIPGRVGAALRAGDNVTPEHAAGGRTFAEFLANTR